MTSRRGGAGPREVRSLGAAGRDRRRHREPPPRPPGPPVSLGGAGRRSPPGAGVSRAGLGPGRERGRHRGRTRGGPVPAPPSLQGRAPVRSGVGQRGPGRSCGPAPHTARHRGRTRSGFSESGKRRDRPGRGGAARPGQLGLGRADTAPGLPCGTGWGGLCQRWWHYADGRLRAGPGAERVSRAQAVGSAEPRARGCHMPLALRQHPGPPAAPGLASVTAPGVPGVPGRAGGLRSSGGRAARAPCGG